MALPERPEPRAVLLEADAADRPFHSPARWTGAPASELDAHGYRVDEYLIHGEAHWYVHDPHVGGAVVDPAQPDLITYCTRAYVVRPRDPKRFSGNVVVEGFNPGIGFDFLMTWTDVGHLQMVDGDAFVAFTYKARSARRLRVTDPDRYGALDVETDRTQWDIIQDVLRLARGPLLGDDLGEVRNVIATGGSQVASLLHAFIAEGLHRPASSDAPASADGYLLNVGSGAWGPFGYMPLHLTQEWDPAEGTIVDFFRQHAVPLDDPRRITPGLDVPVVQWLSEDEALQDWWVSRPDSDAPGDLFRCWQVPGRGHGGGILSDEGFRADIAQVRAAGISGVFDSFHPPVPHPETPFLLSAILQGMRVWQSDGTPMPRVPRIEYDIQPVPRRDEIGWMTDGIRPAHDALGHTRGGLRYPTIDAPIDRMWREPTSEWIPDWRREPMSMDEIRTRYGSPQRWRVLAMGLLDDAITRGVIRADHRNRFADFLSTTLDART